MLARWAIFGLSFVMCGGCTPNAGPSATADPAPSASSAAPPVPSSSPAAPPASRAASAEPGLAPPGLAPPIAGSGTPVAGSGMPVAAAPPANAAPASAAAPAAPSGGSEPVAEGAVRVAAKAGVGQQGQSLQEHSGVIVEAAKAYFNVRQKAVFEIQIPAALKLFEASEGRKPQSHDEFLAKVIAPNNITLPTLPAGSRYVYDPQKGELMVEKPAR